MNIFPIFKIWYEIIVENLWWCEKLNKWVDLQNHNYQLYGDTCSSHMFIKTYKKAIREIDELLEQGCETPIRMSRRIVLFGKIRWITDYEFDRPEHYIYELQGVGIYDMTESRDIKKANKDELNSLGMVKDKEYDRDDPDRQTRCNECHSELTNQGYATGNGGGDAYWACDNSACKMKGVAIQKAPW